MAAPLADGSSSGPAAAAAPPKPLVLTTFFIYETIARVYIVGTDDLQQRFRILKLGRGSGGTLQSHCDGIEYGAVEFQQLLLALHGGNPGGCKMVSEARGVVGTIRLLSTVFLVLVKQASCVGELGTHQVFRADALDFFPLTLPDLDDEHPMMLDEGMETGSHSAEEVAVEAKYEALLRGIEAKDFIFSYTYALHLRMQHTFSGPASPYSKRTAGKPEEVARDALLYVWNSYLLDQMDGDAIAAAKETRFGGAAALLSSGFGLGLVCGSFHQRRVSLLGLPLCLTLLSRRSSEFAGTRFRKRGVNSAGFVANEVETEQIVHVETTINSSLGYRYTSFVQLRGSIPLFWTQKGTKTDPIPKVRPGPADPDYTATAKHFDGLERRYGSPTICLNLVKTRGENREVAIGKAFREAVDAINLQREAKAERATGRRKRRHRGTHDGKRSDTGPESSARRDDEIERVKEAHRAERSAAPEGHARSFRPIVWESQDLHHLAEEHSAQEVICMLGEMGSRMILETTGLFDTGERATLAATTGSSSQHGTAAAAGGHGSDVQNQTGVIRTNCLDCLDRTTVAQFCVGMAALGLQLQRLGLREQPSLSFDDEKDVVLMGLLAELFKLTGHAIALQYGGSEAHLDMMRDGVSGTLGGLATAPGGVSVDGGWGVKLFKSFRRYYSNAFTDRDKQDALNLMLGKFAPWRDLISRGGAYRHIWEWNEDEDGDSAESSRQECDHFLHNPPLSTRKDLVSLSVEAGSFTTISSTSSFGSIASSGSLGDGSEKGGGNDDSALLHGVPTTPAAPSFYVESPVQELAAANNRNVATNRHRLVVDYKVLSDATDPGGWVRFEYLLSAEWRKPVHVYANQSGNHDDIGNGSSGAGAASKNQSLQTVNGREIDRTGELWRQSSAWIEQIGSDKLPPRVSGTEKAAVRSRQATGSNFGDGIDWQTTPGTLRSILIADSLHSNATDAPGSDEGADSTNATNGSRWHSVSAAAPVKAAELDVIARLQRPDVTDQVAAEMSAALSASKHDVDHPQMALFADADSGGTDEAVLFASYVHGLRMVEHEAATTVSDGREGGTDSDLQSVGYIQDFGSALEVQNRASSASNSVGSQLNITPNIGDHDQLYLETYAEGVWHGEQYTSSPSCELPAAQTLTPEERANLEHERWRVDRTAASQQAGQRGRHSKVGSVQQDELASDHAETKSRWILPWAEISYPMPGGNLPYVTEHGSAAGTTAASGGRLPKTTSHEASIAHAKQTQKHRLTRLWKERQHELRQQQMQYGVDRGRKQAATAQTDHKLAMERAHQPATLSAQLTHADMDTAGSTVAADFFAAYLHRSMSDSLSTQAAE